MSLKMRNTSPLALLLLPAIAQNHFSILRQEFVVPTDGHWMFAFCLTGEGYLSARVATFAPGLAFDDVVLETESWEDPRNGWNSSMNRDVSLTAHLTKGGGGGGTCMCSQPPELLGLMEFVQASSRAGLTAAVDIFQGLWAGPPSNWHYGDVIWGSPGSSYPKYIDENDLLSFEGVNLDSAFYPRFSYQMLSVPVLSVAETMSSTSKSIRIDSLGEAFVLRVATGSDNEPYQFILYLVKELNNPNEYEKAVSYSSTYTTSKSDLAEAAAIEFEAAPVGYYYVIWIFKDDKWWGGMSSTTNTSSGSWGFSECYYENNQFFTKNSVSFSLSNGVPNRGKIWLAALVTLLYLWV